MRVLITGSNGYIGKKLGEELSKDYEVLGIFCSKENIINKKQDIQADLTISKDINKIVNNLETKDINSVDVIVHTASEVAVRGKLENKEILHSSAELTFNSVRLSSILSPSLFINLSSMSVYPYIDGTFSEESLCLPSKNDDFLYGLSKLNAEMVLQYFLPELNCRLLNLRISQVYGKGMRKDRIIPMMLEELNTKNSITVYGNGVRTTNFIHVSDLVKAIKFFLESDLSGTFNIGKYNISLLDLAKKLIEKEGDKESRIIKIQEGKTENFILDTSKLSKIIKL